MLYKLMCSSGDVLPKGDSFGVDRLCFQAAGAWNVYRSRIASYGERIPHHPLYH